MKRVLIGCASSCVVLDAFLARGYDASKNHGGSQWIN